MPNQPTPDKLDKIIRIACTEAIAALHPEGGEFPLDSRIVDNAKQAILQLYREWAMDLTKRCNRRHIQGREHCICFTDLRRRLQENQ